MTPTPSPNFRRGLVVLALLFFPIGIYWNTIFHRFGFRDDYSIQREAHEEPGKIMRLCTAMGRPLYGYLLEKTFAPLDRLEDLERIRLLCALLMGVAGSLFFLTLVANGWDEPTSAMLALILTLLPGAQVLVAWAIAWPPALALVFAAAGYWAAETSFRSTRGLVRLSGWLAAMVLVAASLLCYQAGTLFYLAPMAALLFSRPNFYDRNVRDWVIRHAVTLACGGAIAVTVMLETFASGRFPISSRLAFASNVGQTLEWFVNFPLPRALAVFVLKGVGPGSALYFGMIALMVALMLAGVVAIGRRHGWRAGIVAGAATVLLPVAAFAVNLVSTERLPSYRTLIPLSALLLVIVVANLTRLAGRRVTRAGLAALTLAAAWTAYRQPYELIAVPQSYELQLIEDGARQVNPAGGSKVFVITPTLADAPAPVRSGDEFGSLATNSDWVPKEMFIAAVKEVFGRRVSYTFQSGASLPKDQRFDIVVDMRRLREFRQK